MGRETEDVQRCITSSDNCKAARPFLMRYEIPHKHVRQAGFATLSTGGCDFLEYYYGSI